MADKKRKRQLMFMTTDKEASDGQRWIDTHRITCPDAKRYETATAAIAESPFSWCFTGTSLATAVTVRCVCGATQNVSDTDEW